MKYDVVLWDMDGTLLDFDSFWLTISYKAIGDILKAVQTELDLTEEILLALGVKDKVTDINGILCKGT